MLGLVGVELVNFFCDQNRQVACRAGRNGRNIGFLKTYLNLRSPNTNARMVSKGINKSAVAIPDPLSQERDRGHPSHHRRRVLGESP